MFLLTHNSLNRSLIVLMVLNPSPFNTTPQPVLHRSDLKPLRMVLPFQCLAAYRQIISYIIIYPMTDPWCWYINANIDWGYIDGIHGTPYIAAPWIRHGIYQLWSLSSAFDIFWLIRTSFFSLDFSNIFDASAFFYASWPRGELGNGVHPVLAEYRALWGPQDGAFLLQKLGPSTSWIFTYPLVI